MIMGLIETLQLSFGAELIAAFRALQSDALKIVERASENEDTIKELGGAIDDLFDPPDETLKAKTPAPFDRARLGKKYDWKGGNYQKLISEIVARNQEDIATRITGRDKKKYTAEFRKLIPKTERGRIFKFPPMSDIMGRSTKIIKAAESGQLMSKTLREKLRGNLRETMSELGVSTSSGTVPKRLAANFENKMKDTFKGYVRRGPGGAPPANIKDIAVTETRSFSNEVRRQYALQTAALQRDFEITRKWKHNPGLSKTEPRENHAHMDGKSPGADGYYRLKGKGGQIYLTVGPHGPELPVGEVSSCHCEEVFRIKKKPAV